MPHYLLDLADIPDGLYTASCPNEKWLDRVVKAEDRFPDGSLGTLSPLAWKAEAERLIGVPLYLMLNWLPFLLPIVSLAIGGLRGLLILMGILALLAQKPVAQMIFAVFSHIPRALGVPEAQLSGQYTYTERNTQKYLSARMVWADGLEKARVDGKPMILCIIPHGIAPLGITAYPAFSRLVGGPRQLCRWTAAPVVLKIPLIGAMLRALGYTVAKSKAINGVLAGGSSVGIVLDGIAGMFQKCSETTETGYVLQRKAVAAIALKNGVPIVPVYGFGHASLWSVVTDPFGLLERLSIALDVSVCPFYGRWGLPVGPPRRLPVTVAIGDPIPVGEPNPNPSKAEVNELHAKLVAGFTATFEAHKAEYGWASKQLKLV